MILGIFLKILDLGVMYIPILALMKRFPLSMDVGRM